MIEIFYYFVQKKVIMFGSEFKAFVRLLCLTLNNTVCVKAKIYRRANEEQSKISNCGWSDVCMTQRSMLIHI